jgi:hypothetical protein
MEIENALSKAGLLLNSGEKAREIGARAYPVRAISPGKGSALKMLRGSPLAGDLLLDQGR